MLSTKNYSNNSKQCKEELEIDDFENGYDDDEVDISSIEGSQAFRSFEHSKKGFHKKERRFKKDK